MNETYNINAGLTGTAQAQYGAAQLNAVRTIATVASELQSAMDAAARVPKLRAELDGLLGRKRRGAKKEVAK